jgi:anaerobic ribonucleoside-triphosphate reductase
MEKCTCHDCKKTIEHNQEYMPYQVGATVFAKCKDCHQKDSVLRNFQQTEVYSRVVGYIRPVAQWNKGKQAEYGDRSEYIVQGASCCA